MLNKRIATGFMSIAGALAIAGGATFAFFTDTANSTGNTFSTGNADLDISTDNGGTPSGFAENISGPNFTGMFPGESREFNFWLRNNSSASINLNLIADVSTIDPANDATQEVDNTLLVSWICDEDGDLSLADETPTAEFSPRAWLDGGSASLSPLVPNEEMFCRMIGRLSDTASNDIAGETVIFDVEYDATQQP